MANHLNVQIIQLENSIAAEKKYDMPFKEFDATLLFLLQNNAITKMIESELRNKRQKKIKSRSSKKYNKKVKNDHIAMKADYKISENTKKLLMEEKLRLLEEIRYYKNPELFMN